MHNLLLRTTCRQLFCSSFTKATSPPSACMSFSTALLRLSTPLVRAVAAKERTLLHLNNHLSPINQLRPANRTYLNLAKDVIIFEHRSPMFVRFIAFSTLLGACVFCNAAHFFYHQMTANFVFKPDQPDEDSSVTDADNIDDSSSVVDSRADENCEPPRVPLAASKYRRSVAIFIVLMGGLVTFSGLTFVTRNVRQIKVLEGKLGLVTFHTFGPVGNAKQFTVPIRDVSALTGRAQEKGGYIAMKVKGQMFNYVVDRSGDFPRLALFDRTVGIKRDLKE